MCETSIGIGNWSRSFVAKCNGKIIFTYIQKDVGAYYVNSIMLDFSANIMRELKFFAFNDPLISSVDDVVKKFLSLFNKKVFIEKWREQRIPQELWPLAESTLDDLVDFHIRHLLK